MIYLKIIWNNKALLLSCIMMLLGIFLPFFNWFTDKEIMAGLLLIFGFLLAMFCEFGAATLETYKISKYALEKYGKAYSEYEWYCNRVGYKMALKEYENNKKYKNIRAI